jgi:hypothetical protein
MALRSVSLLALRPGYPGRRHPNPPRDSARQPEHVLRFM